MRGRVEAGVILRADNRRLFRDLGKAKGMFRKLGKGVKGAMSSILSPLGVGAGALGFAALGKEVADFEEKLTRLEIQSRGAIDANTFRDKVDTISRATSQSREQVLEAARAFVSMTGDAKNAESMLELFSKTSVAAGVGAEDVARMASSLQQTMNIDPAEMENAFSIILSGGKSGSIEMRELAALIGGVAPQFRRFGEEGAAGLARLNAAIQTIAPEFNNQASEATTGIRSFLAAIEKNAPRIRKNLNIDVFNKDGSLKTTRELVTLFAKAEAKGKNIFKGLGRNEAVRTQRALAANLDKWDELTESQKGAKDVSEDYAKIQKSSSTKMTKAFNEMKLALVETFTPERIRKFADIMEKVAKLVGWAVDHALELGVAFAALKVGSLVTGFMSIAGSMAKAAAASKLIAGGGMMSMSGMGGAIGAGAKGIAALGTGVASVGAGALAGGVALAGGAGVLAGRALDNKFGLSDKISDRYAKRGDSNAFLKDRLNDVGSGRLRSVKTALTFAKDQGLLNSVGGVNTSKAKEVLGSDRLVSALMEAARLQRQAAEKGVDVRVYVDQKGLLKAEANTRRSPQ